MNGPRKMYLTRKIVQHDMPIKLPDCMYKLKNVHGSNGINPVETAAARTRPDITHQKNTGLPEMATLQTRQEAILKQLEDLKKQMLSIKVNISSMGGSSPTSSKPKSSKLSSSSNKINLQNAGTIVINADPNSPPYSLLILQKLWSASVQLFIQTHVHSTISTLPEAAIKFTESLNKFETNGIPRVIVRLIWKEVGINQFELMVCQRPILGECNFLRFIARTTGSLNYDETNYEIDSLLDVCYNLTRSKTKTSKTQLIQVLNTKLGKSEFLFGSSINIVDIAAYSAIKQSSTDVNVNMTKWMKKCENAI